MTAKEQMIAEMEPLLLLVEAAINSGDPAIARGVSMKLLRIVCKYVEVLDATELREALNNPTANAIAGWLGVKP